MEVKTKYNAILLPYTNKCIATSITVLTLFKKMIHYKVFFHLQGSTLISVMIEVYIVE